VLTGAASTSYQLPVIWAGQYMGLVGYQVQKENEENEKRLQQLQDLAKQATLRKAEKKKTQLSLPCRGRKMFMTDKVNDQYIRAEVFKRDVEDRQLAVQRNQRELELLKVSQAQAYHSQGAGQTLVAGRAEQAQRRSIRDIQPLKTKAFMFDKSGIGPR